MDKLHLLILTPYGKYYDANVSFISFRNEDFTLGISPNHSPIISSVDVCELTITEDGIKKTFATSGGIINVKNSEATLILNSIENASEIDIERALSAKKRADERLSNKENGIDIARAQDALNRAMVRINVFNKAKK